MSIQIRDATETDLPAMLEIYNDLIATTTSIYRDEPATLEERGAFFLARTQAGYPVIVAEDETGVIGYATFGDFRQWPGYRFTVEHSVYARKDRRGGGIGGALMKELIARARAMGKHVMIGGVDADNAASLRFHERLGFEKVAHFKQVGFKFGRWLDLTFLQLTL